jgi:hypothetical protein
MAKEIPKATSTHGLAGVKFAGNSIPKNIDEFTALS